MSLHCDVPEMQVFEDLDRLSEFCRAMMASLPRSDQRRWGEIYVRGLLTVPGRKSIRRISEYIVGWRADQSLQQFVNQSTWRWDAVRRTLAGRLSSLYRPMAWVVAEAVFAKNGSSSVGVARQYAPSAGRVLNCQVGLGIFLTGELGGSPVDWRLLLPPEWDVPDERRARVHLPESERPRSRWEYVLEMVDEMMVDWGLPPAPIVVDASHGTQVEPLLQGLEERGLRYVVKVAAGTPLAPVRPALGRDGRGAVARTVGEAAMLPAGSSRTTLSWRNLGQEPAPVSRFVLDPVERPARGLRRHRRPRRFVLAEWLPGGRRPDGLWLTNVSTARVPELIGLVRAPRRTDEELARMRDLGLDHFEGRSFGGWHRHITLVSLAHAYPLIGRYEQRLDTDLNSSSA